MLSAAEDGKLSVIIETTTNKFHHTSQRSKWLIFTTCLFCIISETPSTPTVHELFRFSSARIKSLDLHQYEPWILASSHDGHLYVYDYKRQVLVKDIKVGDFSVRCARFMPSKNWIVAGADDNRIYVYESETLQLVKTLEGHKDYVRALSVHPSHPYLLSASDDGTVRLWNWEQDWQCVRIFEGHTHYIMSLVINPNDSNLFASASLDETVRVWNLESGGVVAELRAHSKGVNCASFFSYKSQQYLVTGGDDSLVKVWSFPDGACVATLEGHTHNVSGVDFLPESQAVVSASEDGSIRMWEVGSYSPLLQSSLAAGRLWSVCNAAGSSKLVVGSDEGTKVLEVK